MEVTLRSTENTININYSFKSGNEANGLPLKRRFVEVKFSDRSLLIENEWDLVQTVHNQKEYNWNIDIADVTLNRLYRNRMFKLNGLKYMIFNECIDKTSTLCGIWCVDSSEVDFIYQRKTSSGIKEFVTTNTLMERYGTLVVRQ